MTRKQKLGIYLLIVIAFVLKEHIYAFLFQKEIVSNQQKFICTTKTENLEEKYQELINAYQYQDNISYHTENSKILFRDIYHLTDTITIYKGKNNNILENNLVVNEEGLVGIISKVNENSSEVELLKNENLKLSVKINDHYGILKYQNNELRVEGITSKADIHIGDKLKTSDISIYPENILIGTVKDIQIDPYEIEKVLIIAPIVDFSNLKYVSIITELRGNS